MNNKKDYGWMNFLNFGLHLAQETFGNLYVSFLKKIFGS
jgi:hypothetical protein